VYALLVGRPDDDTGDGEYMAALKEMAARAAALGHEPALVARHRSEMLISCDRCPALGYADAEDHVIGGSLLDTGPTRRNRRRRRSASCRHARRETALPWHRTGWNSIPMATTRRTTGLQSRSDAEVPGVAAIGSRG